MPGVGKAWRSLKVAPPSQKPEPRRVGAPACVYSTLTVTSIKGLAYVFVLVRVISQRVFWLAVMVGVDAEDVSDATVAEAVVGLDGLAVVGEVGVVDGPTVVDVDVEDVTGDVVTDCARRLLVVVVEDGTAAPEMLSSAALIQGLPLISDKATRRT